MALQPSALYYTSAFLFAATIPKHTLVGLQKVDPAVNTISGSQHEKTKKLLTPTWFHSNLWLITSGMPMRMYSLYVDSQDIALLSVKWARSGGPRSTEEKAIVWSQLAIGAVTGWQYFKHNMPVGLACLWAAPVATVAAMLWQGL